MNVAAGWARESIGGFRTRLSTHHLMSAIYLTAVLIYLALLSGCAGVVGGASSPKVNTSVSFQLTPLSLNFGNVTVGKQTTQSVTLTNTGNTALTVTQATLSNPQFSYSGITLPATLAAGQTISISVSVTPTTAGTVSGTLTAQASSAPAPVAINLSANAVSPQPQISLSSSSIDFGAVSVGSQASSTLSVSNTGGADLTISVLTQTGSEFSVSGITTPKTVPAGQSVMLVSTFRPTTAGASTGTLAITSNDPTNQTSNVTLTGSGSSAAVGQLQASPTSLSFGNVASGSSSAKQITLTNTGTAAVHISTITSGGTGFSSSGVSSPVTINASQAATLTVTFSPATTGSVTGSVTITSDASGSPLTIAVSGTGTAAPTGQLSPNPASLSFGNVSTGASSTKQITLTDTGSAAVQISNITSTGTGFSVSGLSTPATINPSQSAILTVTFAPATTGNVTGSITVTSDATGSPLTIALSGSGAQPGLSLSPSSFDFGSILDGQTKSQSFNITNTGTAILTVTQLTVSGAGYSASGLATPATIAPGQNAAFAVKFAPAAAGTLTGAVSIVSNAPGSPSTVSVNGTGVANTVTVTANPTSLSFGSLNAGSSSSKSVTVTNTGNSNVTLSQITVSATDVQVSGITTPLTLSSGQNATLNVTFAPKSSESVTGDITISSSQSSSAVIAVSGAGLQPAVTVTPTSLNFGNVTVGSPSSHAIQVSNTGTGTLIISQLSATGTGFSTSGAALPISLGAGQLSNFNVQFAPTSTGSSTGSISVVSNAPSSPNTISLAGTGTQGQLSANPSSANFGNVAVGSNGSQSITLTNTGTASVTISGASPSGTGFSLSGLMTPITLNAGQNTTLSAKFAPTAAGSASGSISITSNAPGSPLAIALSGTGTQAQLTPTPASVSFGSVAMGNTNTQTISLKNNGTAGVTISQANVSGSGFSISGLAVPATIVAGGSTTFNVAFSPASSSSVSGSVSLVNNGPSSPLAISLTGTGLGSTQLLGVSPTSLSFGNVQEGSSSSLSVTLTNNGNSNVTIASVTPSGTGFSATGVNSGTVLVPNQAATLNVTFNPTTAGSASGSVSISSNATNSPATISLAGTGTQGQLSANPSSANFGNVAVGSNGSQSITLTNTGTASVTISGASPSGTGFSLSGLMTPITLNAGQNTTLSAKFAPTAAGSASGSISITSNAPGSPLAIALSGTGTQAQLTPTPASVSFGSVAMGNTNTQTISLKNNGTAGVTISQANVSGSGFSISGLAVPATIVAGGSTTFNVAFSPASSSSVSGSVSLVNNGPSSPLAISLTGTGLGSTQLLGVSPTSLSFGNVQEGSSSSLSVTLTNNGNSNVTIASVTPSGTGFGATGVAAGTTLAPNQTATLNVTFDPTTAGSASGSISVSSDATNSPATVSLSGTGIVGSGLDLTTPNCGIQSTAAVVPSASAWQNFTPPAVGSTYTDPGGYCTVKRITNIGSGGQMIPFYSLVQTISAGDTKLLLFNGDAAHWNIYDFNGNVVISGSAFASVTAENSDEPRWDRFDDAAIWGTRGNSIQKCTITMGTPGSMSCAITHTFSEYSKGVVFPADSDMNANGWVPMAGQNVAGGQVEIFMYQPSTNTKAGVYDPPGCTGSINTNEPGCIHRLIATPDNGMSIEGVGAGDKLWRPPFAGAPVQWDPSPDHHSVGYAIDGTTLVGAFEDFDNSGSGGPCYWRPVIAGFTSPGNPGSCPLFPNGQTSNPPEFGWHVSYMDHATRPWVVWTMMGNGTGPECFNAESCYKAPVAWNQSGGNWYPYQAEIVMARVDSNMTSVGQATNKVYRLALSHARQHADAGYYWQDVYAPVSWDGKYVVFSSNAAFAHNPSGCPSGGFSGDCADTYLIGPLF